MQVAMALLSVIGMAASRSGETRSGETTLISNPAKWFKDWVTGGETSAGVAVTEDSTLGVSAWWACVKVISEDLAKLPLEIIETDGSGNKRVLADDPRLAFLNWKANDLPSTAFLVRETLVRDMLTWGNGYAGIERDQVGRPVGLYNIEPWRVDPKIEGGNKPRMYYEVRSADSSKVSRIKAEDMIHVRGPSKDGVVGMSVIKVARESMSLTIAAERYGASFFKKGARPGGVIKHPKGLNGVAKQNIRESFESMASGTDNVARVAILDEGMDFVSMSIPPEDAQFLQTRQLQIEEVCRWFRMPPHKISHLLRATNNNIEHQGIEYVTDTLGGPMCRVESEFNLKLKNKDEASRTFEHDDSELTRGDRKSRFDAYKTGIDTGILTPDEARRMESMNPHPGGIGSKPWVPLNVQLLEDLGKPKDPPTPPQDPAATDPNAPNDPPADPESDPEADPAEPETPRSIDPAKIIATFAPVLTMAARAIANVQADRCERALKHQPAKDWAEGYFNADQEAYARGVVFPAAESIVGALEACGLTNLPPAGELARLATEIVLRRAKEDITGARPAAEVLVGWRSDRPARDAEFMHQQIVLAVARTAKE